jgi:hypothetical protein
MSYSRHYTFPTRQAFKGLLLSCVDGSNYDVDLDTATEDQKIAFLVDTIKSELGWMLEKHTTFAMCKDWLQGLASACTIPFYNGAVVEWLESNGYTVTPHNEYKAIDQYWDDAAFTLAAMVNKAK